LSIGDNAVGSPSCLSRSPIEAQPVSREASAAVLSNERARFERVVDFNI
jgi:hypothetical protein